VLGALLNLSLTWAGQNRTQETAWRDAFVTQFPGMVVAVSWSAFAWSIDPMFFLWSLPVAIPLVLAAPTSVLLSRVGAGQALRKWGMLVIPEEREPLQVLENARAARRESGNASALTAVEEAVVRPRLNRLHQALARNFRLARRGTLLAPLVARCGSEGPDSLSRSELSQLFRDRQSLAELHQLAWQSPPDSFWGRRITRLSRRAHADC